MVVSGAEQERLADAVYAPENVASAALVVAIVGEAGAFDTGRCAQNMMLGAWGDGVVSCPNGIRDADAAAEICGGDVRAIVSFGYPARPRDPDEPQRGGVVGAGEPQAALRARPRSRLAAHPPRPRGGRPRRNPSNSLLQGWTVGDGDVSLARLQRAETLSNSLLLGRTWRLRAGGGRSAKASNRLLASTSNAIRTVAAAAGPQLSIPSRRG